MLNAILKSWCISWTWFVSRSFHIDKFSERLIFFGDEVSIHVLPYFMEDVVSLVDSNRIQLYCFYWNDSVRSLQHFWAVTNHYVIGLIVNVNFLDYYSLSAIGILLPFFFFNSRSKQALVRSEIYSFETLYGQITAC